MKIAEKSPKSSAFIYWKIVQFIFWLMGIGMMFCLVFFPPLGVTLFWNIVIPVAPALLVIATGVWRNVCPLATTAMIPDRLGFSKRKQMTVSQQQTLNLFGVLLLFSIIPLRHVLFNISGQATALIIFSLSTIGFSAGFIFESKSAWCSGLCPVHSVEKLYGSGVGFSVINAHCASCVKCSVPCPDSTKSMSPQALKSGMSHVTEILLAGAFPGYIWGWFQVPDYTSGDGFQNLSAVYEFPVIGALVTISLYLGMKKIFPNSRKELMSIFAAAAVSCYYWFRLPQLFGFSPLHTTGMLINLTKYIPSWSMYILNLTTTAFFLWWMVIENNRGKSWSKRPPYLTE